MGGAEPCDAFEASIRGRGDTPPMAPGPDPIPPPARIVILGITGDPVFLRHNFWPQAIPQYDLGHERVLAAIETCEQTFPRLHIGGQIRDGISVPACLQAGLSLAERAVR